MGKFLITEKQSQVIFKVDSKYFSEEARKDGIYKGNPYGFCLPREYADQNLFSDFRESAISHFAKHDIKWHDGQKGKPSNHLCDSQVCCVNFLFPFSNKPDLLKKLLFLHYPNIKQMVPIEDNLYVSFEWIGQNNYLCEKISNNGKRTRGANFTSADAIIMFERTDRRRQIVLIEWKYTESYYPTFLKYSDNGTDRTKIYKCLFDRTSCPIDKNILGEYDSLFYEPFYQLMRQQLLAHEMEKEHEKNADIVSVLHIAPFHNKDFRRITSPKLKSLGNTPTEVWAKLVREKDRFLSVSTESVFGKFKDAEFHEIKKWIEYIGLRYKWINE
jgi:hypothetical protein